MKHDICGLGNALVDALVLVDDADLLVRHDLTRGTMHLVDDARWQAAFADVRDAEVEMHPGGSCANAIATAALLGADTTFIGMVGDDTLGDTYRLRMEEAIGPHYILSRQGAPTGKCLSLVSRRDAERTMLTDLGAAMALREEELPPDVIEASHWLHITGYLFTGGAMPRAAFSALDRALQAGTRISFDLGDAFVIQHYREAVELVIRRYADLVFMNEEEGRLLAGGDAAHALHQVGQWVDIAVVKLGRRGSLIKRGAEIIPVGAHLVQAVDTTGAGDAYAGGFLYGLCRGFDLSRAGRLASRVAALTVAQVGGVVRDRAALQECIVAEGAVPLRHAPPAEAGI